MSTICVKIENNTFYYENIDYKIGDNVIVKTNRNLQFGTVISILDNSFETNEKIVRIANSSDYIQNEKNKKMEKQASLLCKKMIKENNLNMSLIDCNYNLDRTQLLFRFISDERVDFRKLAKDLGSKLKTRIELRQIGVRDKAKEIGGIGPCGRFLCCNTFLHNFDTVSINMAKNQGLALNPSKINGVCGRLLCCLNYENENYIHIRNRISHKQNEKEETSISLTKKITEVDHNAVEK